ncbi:hypothetical protein CGMCC3_g3172 [Colletotrichum fructicola]|nr:uncharacterized protein CGMCC3_g3172 [Colletotrichum fructicola]KAE9580825.1 hypothetical protein CGMCC3_g3172 [Colletotrichum fructicola]
MPQVHQTVGWLAAPREQCAGAAGGALPCSLDTYPSSYPTSPRAPNLGKLST